MRLLFNYKYWAEPLDFKGGGGVNQLHVKLVIKFLVKPT